MPPASIVARIRESEPVRQQANKFGPGVSPSWDSDSHVCSIEFDSGRYNREMAEIWLREHDYGDSFTIEEREETEEKSRTFGYPFTSLGGKFEKTPEGGLRVKGVKLLAVGTWTDSAQRTACEYSAETLKQYAGNWHDYAIWSRHFGGVPRSITEKIGMVENPRFESDAVVGDLFYHGVTQQSRDTISMIENGLANFVSVETISKEKWNVGKKVYQAQELGFTGLATVNQGACRVCKIRDNEAEAAMPDKEREDETVTDANSLENLRDAIRSALTSFLKITEKQYLYIIATLPDQVIYSIDDYQAGTEQKFRVPYRVENNQVIFGTSIEVTVAYQDIEQQSQGAFEESEMDAKELEAVIEAKMKAFSEQSETKIKELEGKLAASETANRELSERLAKIEDTPVPPASAGTSGDAREFEQAPVLVQFKNGVISRRG